MHVCHVAAWIGFVHARVHTHAHASKRTCSDTGERLISPTIIGGGKSGSSRRFGSRSSRAFMATVTSRRARYCTDADVRPVSERHHLAVPLPMDIETVWIREDGLIAIRRADHDVDGSPCPDRDAIEFHVLARRAENLHRRRIPAQRFFDGGANETAVTAARLRAVRDSSTTQRAACSSLDKSCRLRR